MGRETHKQRKHKTLGMLHTHQALPRACDLHPAAVTYPCQRLSATTALNQFLQLPLVATVLTILIEQMDQQCM